MIRIIIGVWIYLVGLVGAVTTAGWLSFLLAAYPPSQIQAFGPIVPMYSRSMSGLLSVAPQLLGVCAVVTAAAGIYLWRSRRPVETRLFAAAVISSLNLFLAMFFSMGMLVAYFYLPKVANGI